MKPSAIKFSSRQFIKSPLSDPTLVVVYKTSNVDVKTPMLSCNHVKADDRPRRSSRSICISSYIGHQPIYRILSKIKRECQTVPQEKRGVSALKTSQLR